MAFHVLDSAGISSPYKVLHIYEDAMLMINAPSGGHLRFAGHQIHYNINSIEHQFSDSQISDIKTAMREVSKLIDIDFIEDAAEQTSVAGSISWSYSSNIANPRAVGQTIAHHVDNPYFYSDIKMSYEYFKSHLTTDKGTAFYTAVLHELCHALGLQHPYGLDNALYGNNSLLTYTNFGRYYSQSELTMSDLRTLQELYGARQVGAGDDTLILQSPVTDPNAPYEQYIYQNSYSNNTMTLVDAGGNNTLDLKNLISSYTFNLDVTNSSSAVSTVAFGTYFSKIYCADVAARDYGAVYGSSKAEKIYGGTGFDIISGGGGDDEIDGGAGGDWIQLTKCKLISGGSGLDLLTIGKPYSYKIDIEDNYTDLSMWDLTYVNGFEGLSIGMGMVKLSISDILAIKKGSDYAGSFRIEATRGCLLDLDMSDIVREEDQTIPAFDDPKFNNWSGSIYYRSISHPDLELAISKNVVLV